MRSRGAVRAFVTLAVAVSLVAAVPAIQPAQAAAEDWRYRRAFDLEGGAHIADLGLIDGTPHLAIQNEGEIQILAISQGGYLLRNRITNPALSGDWGHLLAEIPDADGDGVTDIATFAGSYRFYVLSGKLPFGQVLSGEDAKVYSIDMASAPHSGVAAPRGSGTPTTTVCPTI